MHKKHVTVIGAGAWGTALGLVAHTSGAAVRLWTSDTRTADIINSTHTHTALPGTSLPKDIVATDHISSVSADLIIFSVPTQFVRNAINVWKPYIPKDIPLLLVAKGMEIKTGDLVSNIIDQDILTAVLSGPNFAIEVAQGKPSAATVACDENLWKNIASILSTSTFRPYHTLDKVGVQLGGALKNVVAIACGFTRGLNLGENAQAALITRALNEIQQLGINMGANANTFDGLSGMGDLMLTCFGNLSRNMQFGKAWIDTPDSKKLLQKFGTVEGVHTAKSVTSLSKKHNVEMPICTSVYEILYEKKSPLDALRTLFERPLRHE